MTAIDLAPDMLDVARAIPAAGAPIEWHHTDAASLPLPDASYDVALCQMGLMFMEDRTGALAELHRVLTPGGACAMSWAGSVVCMFDTMVVEGRSRLVSESDGLEKEIVELHEAWFAAAAAKDLDASMAPISPDVVSYEHTTPLQLTEVSAIREECRAGFERAADDFTWTVPDLRVLVSDDLAVAWGLNRMADRHPDGTEDVTWSRGTRVFQRSGGRWRMVHQHVSFPVDPATGMAATDLAP